MRIMWFLPFTVLLIAAGMFARARRRSHHERALTSEPVSGEWLAEARSREEHPW